jgi:hypothetical protein
MRDSSQDARQTPAQETTVISTQVETVEFSLPLHVCKKFGRDGKPDVYILAAWNGATSQAICLLQPLETALEALGRILTAAGTTEATGNLVAR